MQVQGKVQIDKSKEQKQEQTKKEQEKQLEKRIKYRNRNKRSKDFVYQHLTCGRTSQPIYQYRGQYKSPYNLVGYIYGECKEKTSYIKEDNFFGTCLVVHKNIAIASKHQIRNQSERFNFFIRLPKLSFEKNDFYQLKVKSFEQSLDCSLDQLSKNDFILLKIQYQNKQEEEQIKRSADQLLFSDGESYEYKSFAFLSGINFGYINKLQEQNKSLKINDQRLLFSKGSIYKYNKGILQYDAYTINGMSGGPIFIENKKKLLLIGMHLYGNCKKQKNYGLIFTQKLYKLLNRLRRQQYKQEENIKYQQIKQLIQQKYSLENKLNEIKDKDNNIRINQTNKILEDLISELKNLELQSIYVQSIQNNNIMITDSEIILKNPTILYNLFQKQNFLQKHSSIYFLRKLASDISKQIIGKENSDDNSWLNFLLKLIYRFISLQQIYKNYQNAKNKIQKMKRKKLKNSQKQEYSQTNFNFFQQTLMSMLPKDKKAKFQMSADSEPIPLSVTQYGDYKIQQFYVRFESFTYLIKYNCEKLTKKSFMRVYIAMISQIYASIYHKLRQNDDRENIKKLSNFDSF